METPDVTPNTRSPHRALPAFALLVAGLMPLLVQAQELRPTYNEVSVAYGRTKGDLTYRYGLARMELGSRAHAAVDLYDGSFGNKNNGDRRGGSVTVGFHTPISGNTDFIAEGKVQGNKIKYPGFDEFSANAYSARVGVKYRPNKVLQLQPTLAYSYQPSNRFLSSYRTPIAELQWSADFHPNWGVTGVVSAAKSGYWEWNVGPRFTW